MAESARLQQRRNGGEELSKTEVRGGGREELSQAPRPEARGAAGRTKPTSKELWLHGRGRA